jgi:hypothetical protein
MLSCGCQEVSGLLKQVPGQVQRALMCMHLSKLLLGLPLAVLQVAKPPDKSLLLLDYMQAPLSCYGLYLQLEVGSQHGVCMLHQMQSAV